MNGLQTARVVIVDDEEKEGLALLKAFSNVGIGATYFSGNEREYPRVKLKGIRLLALDMDLYGEGGPLENKAKLPRTIDVVTHLFDEGSSPFMIIAWTKHEDLVSDFMDLLSKERPDLIPCFVTSILKSDVKEGTDFDIDRIRSVLLKQIQDSWPLDFFLDWEQLVHDAATETTNTLSRLVDIDQGWSSGMQSILTILMRAASGKTLQDSSTAFRALLEALNPIHFDRLRQLSGKIDKPTESIMRLITAEPSEENREAIKAKINNMLLITPVNSNNCHPSPGNIYLKEGWYSDSPFPISEEGNVPHRGLVEDMMNYKEEGKKDEVFRNSFPVLVDITPLCDYVQGCNHAKLVPGLFIPSCYHNRIEQKSPAVKVYGPLNLKLSGNNSESKDCFLLLDARYIMGIKYADLQKHKEFFRLRNQIVIDIQHWFASHAARPGVLSIPD